MKSTLITQKSLLREFMEGLLDPRICNNDDSISPVVYIGRNKFLYENSARFNLVCVKSEDYQAFAENVAPELFILDECYISYDRSWKLNPKELNNIKHFISFVSKLRTSNCVCMLISRDEGVLNTWPDTLKSLFHEVISLSKPLSPESKILLKHHLEKHAKDFDTNSLVDQLCT